MALLSGDLFQCLGDWPPSIKHHLRIGRKNSNPDKLIGQQLSYRGMAITFLSADRHLHGGRLEMPDPRYGALKGALFYAIRFDPVGKTSRETANQKRTDTEAPRQHAAQLPGGFRKRQGSHLKFCSNSMKCLKCPLTRSRENWYISEFSENFCRSVSISTVLPSAAV